jgi:hypothetical protein
VVDLLGYFSQRKPATTDCRVFTVEPTNRILKRKGVVNKTDNRILVSVDLEVKLKNLEGGEDVF